MPLRHKCLPRFLAHLIVRVIGITLKWVPIKWWTPQIQVSAD